VSAVMNLLGYMKCEEFLDQLNDSQLLMKESALWRQFVVLASLTI
jgi:hypothetical protein